MPTPWVHAGHGRLLAAALAASRRCSSAISSGLGKMPGKCSFASSWLAIAMTMMDSPVSRSRPSGSRGLVRYCHVAAVLSAFLAIAWWRFQATTAMSVIVWKCPRHEARALSHDRRRSSSSLLADSLPRGPAAAGSDGRLLVDTGPDALGECALAGKDVGRGRHPVQVEHAEPDAVTLESPLQVIAHRAPSSGLVGQLDMITGDRDSALALLRGGHV